MSSSPPERTGAATARLKEILAPDLDGARAPAEAPPVDALSRAAAAMDEVRGELSELFAQDVLRLAQARDDWRLAPEGDALARLKRCAHELKGLGATCGHPLAGRLGASLEHLLDELAPPACLVHAHVDAVLAMIGREPKEDHAADGQLTDALEAAVAARR